MLQWELQEAVFFCLFVSHEILKESSAKSEDEGRDVGGLKREEEEC